MQKLFSQCTKEELKEEANRLKEEMIKKRAEGEHSRANVLEKRYYLALSYLKDPGEILPGVTYSILGDGRELMVEWIDGVMAWGYLYGDRSGEMVAFPIGQLAPKRTCHHHEHP
ncbi:DUF1811 family protein [Thermicanus aegyptius]|uniref:DUF1811 family protein n=1 Tax=Thermicanus aegyptius TaxID=94009 RepID=UPI000346077D|nr:DUF1811 family protein [Thermicanus aegyptius]